MEVGQGLFGLLQRQSARRVVSKPITQPLLQTVLPAHHVRAEVRIVDWTRVVAEVGQKIRVDLAEMEGTSLRAGDIALPEGCVLAEDPNTSIISITFVAEEAEGEEVDVDGGEEPTRVGGDEG